MSLQVILEQDFHSRVRMGRGDERLWSQPGCCGES